MSPTPSHGRADYLLIGEAVLGVPAQTLARLHRIGLAESALAAPAAAFGEVEVYPEIETKGAVLLWHLVKNHPLPDGNKRCAFLAAVLFAELNGRSWRRAPDDPDATDKMIRSVAAGATTVDELVAWVRARLGQSP